MCFNANAISQFEYYFGAFISPKTIHNKDQRRYLNAPP